MRKNYLLLKNDQIDYRKKYQLKSFFYIAVIALLLPVLGHSQSTVLLSPTVNNGGFESVPPATGWTLSVGAVNRTQFTVGTGAAIASPASGTNSAYVTTNINTPAAPNSNYVYTNTALVKATHLYRDILIPAGQSIIKLNFVWKGGGYAGEDRMRVFVVPTTTVPAYGTLITTTAGYTQLGGEYVNQPNWAASPTLTLNPAWAGTTIRLVFEWNDSATTGTSTQPVAIDNINLISYNPLSDECANAIPLTTSSSCVNETYTNVGASNSVVTSGAPSTTCGTFAGADVWYSAIIGGDGTLNTTVTATTGGMNDPVMAIYSGTCGALTLLQCADDTNGLMPQINLTGQTPYSQVYIRIWPYSPSTTPSGTFNICATAPSCFTPSVLAATSITTTTATINWAPNAGGGPSGGYQYYYSTTNSPPPGAGTASAGTSANLTGLTQNTTYYVFVRGFCGGTDYSAWSAVGTFTTVIPAPTTTSVSYCAGGSGSLTGTAVCTVQTNIGNSISGTLSASDPTAPRMPNFTVSANACSFTGPNTNYTSLSFQVSVSGAYVFTMDNNTLFDGMAYITSGAFVPGNCTGGGTFLAGDDDSAGSLEPQVQVNLTAGVSYTIYTQALANGGNGAFSYTVSGPGNILATSAGQLQWWTANSGGTMIGVGTPFDPVGVTGSGVTNNTTPITRTYYAACSGFPNIRTAATFTIVASPSSVISGSGSACGSGTVNMSIALSGTSPWTFTYTDGVTPVTVTNTSTTPYTFSVSPTGTAVSYTVSALSNAACPTTTAAYRTGSGDLYNKVWLGGSGSDWATAANWAPSGAPSATDCVVVNNVGTPPVIGTGIYGYGSKLTVGNGATLTVNANQSLTITNGVTVATSAPAGNIVLADDASLVQITDVSSNNNTGNITFNRTATMQRADYVYWSSPFSALNANLIFPTTNTYYIWKWNPSLANPNGGQGYWINGNDSPMTIGKGYIVRAPDTHPWTPTDYAVTLTGRPNNGIINTPVTRGSITAPFPGNNSVMILATDDNWNLIGNPYPSSIDAVKFLTDNNSNLADLNVRLWTHNNPIGGASSSFYNNYVWGYADSYTTFNISGPNPPGWGGKIASGQAFFVSVNEVSPTVQFNNTMRGYNYDNSQFFKTSDNNNINYDSLQRSRIWVSILNEANANATTMICYVEGATLEKDRLFDAPSKDIGSLGLYSLVNDEKMTIQGRPAFNPSDIVPLAYTAEQNGIYKIAIANLDGLFEEDSNEIYLEDTLLGVMHNLKDTYYTFTSNTGTFDTRFRLHYASTALGNSDVDDMNTFSYINNNVLNIKSTKNIEQVDIYDITGKLIKSCKATSISQNFETDFNYPNAVYVLRIKLENGVYVTKKQIK